MPQGRVDAEPQSLSALLGGRRGAVDATLPSVVFVAAWLLTDRSVGWAAAAAVAAGTGIAAWRLYRGARPRAVLVGMLAVCVAAAIVLRTGRAADFFLLQIAINAASAFAWTVSIALRWPLLGLVVGTVLGQRASWQRDPDLVRAYSRASWIWVGQYALRIIVLFPLWQAGHTVALAGARIALTWPLIAACLALSWSVLRRSLPAGHPGLRHPRPR